MNSLIKIRTFIPRTAKIAQMSSGKAGAIREEGGAFGKREAASEAEYFHKKQREQLQDLKSKKITEEEFHQKQIKDLEEAVLRHKQSLQQLKK